MKPFCRRLAIMLLVLGSSPLLAQQQIDVEDFDLSDYKGKVVYLDFWASWCTPCRASFPFMAEITGIHGDELAIVAVNVDEKPADALDFLKDYEVPFDVVFDHAGQLATEYKVPGMPTSYLFDRDGTPIGSHVGFRKKDMDAIREWITDAVSK